MRLGVMMMRGERGDPRGGLDDGGRVGSEAALPAVVAPERPHLAARRRAQRVVVPRGDRDDGVVLREALHGREGRARRGRGRRAAELRVVVEAARPHAPVARDDGGVRAARGDGADGGVGGEAEHRAEAVRAQAERGVARARDAVAEAAEVAVAAGHGDGAHRRRGASGDAREERSDRRAERRARRAKRRAARERCHREGRARRRPRSGALKARGRERDGVDTSLLRETSTPRARRAGARQFKRGRRKSMFRAAVFFSRVARE